MKKILFIMPEVSSLPSIENGGAVETLIEHLLKKNEEEKKYQITIVSKYNSKSYEESKKYRYTDFIYIKVNKLIKKIKKRIYKLLRLNRTKLEWEDYLKQIKKVDLSKYDKVIVQNRPQYILELENENLILHLHNNHLLKTDSNYEFIYRKCKNIWCVSKFIKNSVEKYSDEKVKVFFNCVDINKFNKELYLKYKEKFREKYGIKKDDIVYMFSGRLDKTKGIKELVEAFSKLKYENIKLLIIGAYDYGKKDKNKFVLELEEAIKKIQSKVIFTGFIDRNEIPKYHAISDIAIVPSIWEEPSGLVVMEAQASKLPLITTNRGGIPEIINTNNTFLLDVNEEFIGNLKEKMEYLYLNEMERIKRGELGRKFIKKYDLNFYWEQFVKLIDEKL